MKVPTAIETAQQAETSPCLFQKNSKTLNKAPSRKLRSGRRQVQGYLFGKAMSANDEFNAQFRGRFAKLQRREIQLIKNENNPETNSQMALDN